MTRSARHDESSEIGTTQFAVRQLLTPLIALEPVQNRAPALPTGRGGAGRGCSPCPLPPEGQALPARPAVPKAGCPREAVRAASCPSLPRQGLPTQPSPRAPARQGCPPLCRGRGTFKTRWVPLPGGARVFIRPKPSTAWRWLRLRGGRAASAECARKSHSWQVVRLTSVPHG
jgi:hypothetical protein